MGDKYSLSKFITQTKAFKISIKALFNHYLYMDCFDCPNHLYCHPQ